MKRLLSILILASCLISCSSARFESFSSLSNKGMLPLSTSNPYVGSNLFIAEEFSRSSHLYNFLLSRGGPTAIQVEETRFGSPHLLMYYPIEKEVFSADLNQSENNYQWIIRGPFRIERKDYRELAGMNTSGLGEPAFMNHGKLFHFKPTAEELLAKMTPTPLPTPIPTPTKRKPTKIITKLEDTKSGVESKKEPEPWKPMNSDQQAISMAQGFAERAPNGDVIHTVKSDGESFEKISQWYTGTPANAQELAKANGFPPDGPPKVGARVQIPLKIIKQFKVLK